MKTLGILEDDTLYPDLLAEYQSYGNMLRRFLQAHGQEFEAVFYDVQKGELPTPFACDAYLLTGSKAGVYDDLPWLAPLASWITRAYGDGEKLMGVCFGHQMIAHSLGGFAAKSPKGWGVGLATAQINNAPNWAKAAPSELCLIYSHQDQVEILPPNAQRLAGNDFCPNAAFFIANQVLCVQGHPEFDVAYTERLLKRRAQAIGEELLSQRLAELRPTPDAKWIAQWMGKLIQL